MSKSSKTKDYGGHKGGGKDYGGHKGGKDYGDHKGGGNDKPDKVCKTDPQPQPDPKPCPPPDNTDCRPVGDMTITAR